ncbi:hypothetical protein COK29_30025, partial [Bacillus cereus]
YLNALPLISIVASIVLLDEALTGKIVIGGSLVLIGVGWADKQKISKLLKKDNLNSKEC